jgi:hypothetical protein
MLAEEHLDGSIGSPHPAAMFDAFARSAAGLQAWYDGGRRGPRPPGRIRPLDDQVDARPTRLWAEPLYRAVYDPDARRLGARARGTY